MELVLYQYWRSSSSWRVRFALAYKGLAYESRAVNLQKSEQIENQFRARSPMGVVPCLLVDGRPLAESMAILEFLEEIAPERPLLPKDPWKRALVRQTCEVIISGIQPLHNLVVLRKASVDGSEQKAWAQFFLRRGFEALEQLLVSSERAYGGAFSVGDEPTLADACLLPQVAAAARFEVDLSPFPRVREVHARCLELPAAQASAPERQVDAPRA